MSDADVRSVPSRGRSSARGGRGGFGRGGPRGGRKQANGTSNDGVAFEEESLEDQGELGEMKKKYSAELGMLKDMFPDWTDTDLVFALEEADGDIPACVDKITQGTVSQFAEVKKSKDRARSKAKDDTTLAGATDKPAFAARGGRGRGGFEGTRGGRGRGVERGRGGQRGGRGGHATTNGAEAGATSVPTTESSAWDTAAPSAETANNSWDDSNADVPKDAVDPSQSGWGNVVTADATPAAASEGAKSSLIPEGGAKKSWASMFAKPKPAPAPAIPKQVPSKQPAPQAEPLPAAPVEEPKEATPVPTIEQPQAIPTSETPADRPATAETEVLTPSKDPLTEANVEHLPDESNPPATQTVASTAGSIDPRNLTPLPSQQAPIGRPPLGGFATSANRLAGAGGRSASFQRRVLEQQEAVVMPGHNAVDRAAVQFGSMGLNGEPGPDVDEEREEPETRHAPQHSPPSQPRTSLPPAPRQASGAQDLPEAVPTPKQAPGLPPASAQNQQQIQDPSLAQNIPQDQQMNQTYNQYGQYGQPGMQRMQQESAQQKQYDPFGHQAQHSFDQYAGHQQQQQSQSGFGGLSSAPSEYSQYYTADQQPRNAYNQYYGSSYGQQQQQHDPRSQGQHDPTIGQQRSASGFGAGQNESVLAAQTQQQASRFNEAPGSGNNTPNPMAAQQQSQQQQHSMHQAQGHQQQQGGYPPGASAAFPYGHPYYNSPYQTAYANQFGYSHQYGGASAGGYPTQQQQKQQGGAGAMYGAPQGYGQQSSYGQQQSSYDPQHSASPANANAFAQNQQGTMRSASGMGSALGGLDDYGRQSAQPSAHQQSNAFGGMNDPFARSSSGFGTQGGYGQQQQGSNEDALKPFPDPSPSKSGPSPQPGRPGSAANSAAGNAQAGGLPPPQSQHSAFGGGYPGFPGQGQYGGLGGLGSQGQQGQQGQGQQSAYGSYGAGGFSQAYGGYGSRGGWGQQYGGH